MKQQSPTVKWALAALLLAAGLLAVGLLAGVVEAFNVGGQTVNGGTALVYEPPVRISSGSGSDSISGSVSGGGYVDAQGNIVAIAASGSSSAESASVRAPIYVPGGTQFHYVDEHGNFVAEDAPRHVPAERRFTDSAERRFTDSAERRFTDSSRGYTPNSHAVFDSVQVGDGRAWILADGSVHATSLCMQGTCIEAAQLAKLDQLASAAKG